MQHDRSVKSCVEQIRSQTQEFLDYVNSNNQCAYSDRMVENILKTAEKLDKVYSSNFESVEKKQENELTADERFEKEFEKAMPPTRDAVDHQKEIEVMVSRFFLNDAKEVYSENLEWRIASGGNDLVGEIYYNDKPACQIKNTLSGYKITPSYAEVDFVADYTENALKTLRQAGYHIPPVKVNYKYYDENEELDLTQQTERGR